ncbi:4Fe-4S dicluster domain-containing protein [Thermodesulfobacteriota bacterium]
MNQKNIFVDLEYCIGCRACEVACKQENDIPVGVKWINVVKVGPKMVGDKLRMDFVPMRCRHCAKAPCIDACPEKSISKRSDGIVLIDRESCNGCMACAEACFFDSIQLNAKTQVAEKCTLCVNRIDAGLEPACVRACPSKCMYFGDINELTRINQTKKAERLVENPVSLA